MAYLTFARSFAIPAMFMLFAYAMCFNVEMRTFDEALSGKRSATRYWEDREKKRAADELSLTGFFANSNLSPVVPRPGGGTGWRVFPVVVASASTALVWPATLIIFGICRAHMFYNFGRDRFRRAGLHRYPGEPLSFWNPLYVLFDRLNFRSNLVKVVCEPVLCVFVGVVLAKLIQQMPALSERLLFLPRWFVWGGILLAIKAGLDQKARVTQIMEVEDQDKSVRARQEALERRLSDHEREDEPTRYV